MPDLDQGPRAALVVATSVYADESLRRLRAPARDAADLVEVLADPQIGGFDVSTVIDGTAHEVRLGIERFLSGRKPEDLVVMYLSCHGVLNSRNQLFFAAGDTLKAHLGATGVESRWVLDQLDDCRAKRQVLILDCCFSGAFAHGAKGDADLDLGQRMMGQGRGRIVLTASRAGEYSFEGEALSDAVETGSVFTNGLVEGLRSGAADVDRDGYVSVEDAYDYAFEHVRARGANQTPQRWLYGAEGRIWLAFNPAARAAGVVPAEVPESIRAGLASPYPEIQLGAVSVLGQWLDDADAAQTLMARKELEQVAGGEVPGVAAAAGSLLDGVPAIGVSTGSALALVIPPGKSLSGRTPPPKSGGWIGLDGGNDRVLVSAESSVECLAIFGGQLGSANAVAFSPTKDLLAFVANNTDVALWRIADPTKPRHVSNFVYGGYRLHAVAFSPDGDRLATRGTGNKVLLRSVSIPALSYGQRSILVGGALERHAGVHSMAFSPDGHLLAVAGERASVWDLESTRRPRQLVVLGDHMHVTSVAFSPSGRLLATLGKKLLLWDMADPENPLRFGDASVADIPTGASALAFSPDGSLLAVNHGTSMELLELRGADPNAAKSLVSFGHATGGVINAVSFSPGGRLVATSDGITVLVWDISDPRSPRLNAVVSDPVHFVDAVAFSARGRLLATCGKQARLWKLGSVSMG